MKAMNFLTPSILNVGIIFSCQTTFFFNILNKKKKNIDKKEEKNLQYFLGLLLNKLLEQH